MSEPDEPFPEPVELPVEDALDLHAFSPQDIPSVVESYLEAAVEAGFREVRVIHGRGKGVQKKRVQSVLSRSPLVDGYQSSSGAWRLGSNIGLAEEDEMTPGYDAVAVSLRSRK